MQFSLVSALCGQINQTTKKPKIMVWLFLTDIVQKDKCVGILCLPPLDLFHGSLNFCKFGYILWQLFSKEQILS